MHYSELYSGKHTAKLVRRSNLSSEKIPLPRLPCVGASQVPAKRWWLHQLKMSEFSSNKASRATLGRMHGKRSSSQPQRLLGPKPGKKFDSYGTGCKKFPRWLGVDGMVGAGAAQRIVSVSSFDRIVVSVLIFEQGLLPSS